ncbi:MAG: hypothetical protein PVH65_01165, partial [Chloroflexota bacterium]
FLSICQTGRPTRVDGVLGLWRHHKLSVILAKVNPLELENESAYIGLPDGRCRSKRTPLEY